MVLFQSNDPQHITGSRIVTPFAAKSNKYYALPPKLSINGEFPSHSSFKEKLDIVAGINKTNF